VTTLAPSWRDARARDPDFAGVRWNRRLEVETTTIDRLIARFGVPAFIKIDVEGAEWDSLLDTPDAVLDQIDQIPMELHLPHSPFLRAAVVNERHLQVIKKLKQKFFVVNLHFNNASCTRFSAPLPALAFQVLLVNKRVGVLDQAAPTPAPMSALNAPDLRGQPDCQPPT
jgi:hypothetical protein